MAWYCSNTGLTMPGTTHSVSVPSWVYVIFCWLICCKLWGIQCYMLLWNFAFMTRGLLMHICDVSWCIVLCCNYVANVQICVFHFLLFGLVFLSFDLRCFVFFCCVVFWCNMFCFIVFCCVAMCWLGFCDFVLYCVLFSCVVSCSVTLCCVVLFYVVFSCLALSCCVLPSPVPTCPVLSDYATLYHATSSQFMPLHAPTLIKRSPTR